MSRRGKRMNMTAMMRLAAACVIFIITYHIWYHIWRQNRFPLGTRLRATVDYGSRWSAPIAFTVGFHALILLKKSTILTPTPHPPIMEVFSFELVVRFPEIAQASSSLLGCCNHHHHHHIYDINTRYTMIVMRAAADDNLIMMSGRYINQVWRGEMRSGVTVP